MSKIFVRERRRAGRGAGRPRFAIVAVHDADLKIIRPCIRKVELEAIAAEIGAHVVYLPRGEEREGPEDDGGSDHRRRRPGRRRRRDQDVQ